MLSSSARSRTSWAAVVTGRCRSGRSARVAHVSLSVSRSRMGLSSMGSISGSPGVPAQDADAGHDGRAPHHGQGLVPLEVTDRPPAQLLEPGHGPVPVGEPLGPLAEQPVHGEVEAGEPGQVVLGRPDRGHVPVEHGHGAARRRRAPCSRTGRRPTAGRAAGSSARTVLPAPGEGPGEGRAPAGRGSTTRGTPPRSPARPRCPVGARREPRRGRPGGWRPAWPGSRRRRDPARSGSKPGEPGVAVGQRPRRCAPPPWA